MAKATRKVRRLTAIDQGGVDGDEIWVDCRLDGRPARLAMLPRTAITLDFVVRRAVADSDSAS